jgi:predicted O-methyltransferase YrrM
MNYKTAKGILRDDEADRLYELACSLPPNACMVNIGVEHGKSCVCLRQGCPNGVLYAVDIDLTPLDASTRDDLGDLTILVEEDSRKWVPIVVAGKAIRIDLAFIDGLHYQEFVRNDVQLAQLVIPGGFIVFHDAYWWERIDVPQPEVYPPIQEWFDQNRSQWQELPKVGTMRIFKRTA